MGIIKTATDQFQADVAAFKATNPTRAQKRKYVAAIVNAGNEWLAKFDAQDNAAPADFAASKAGQFQTFTDGIADPVLAPVDPTT